MHKFPVCTSKDANEKSYKIKSSGLLQCFVLWLKLSSGRFLKMPRETFVFGLVSFAFEF